MQQRWMMGIVMAAACGTPPDEASDAATSESPTELTLAADAARAHLETHAMRFGLGEPGALRHAAAFADDGARVHVRFQQLAGGVPVFGGEAIVHLAHDRSVASVSDGFVPRIAIDPTPAIAAGGAAVRAREAARCAACDGPAPDLWALRHGGRDHLVWRVRLRIEDGTARTAMPVVFVDAHDGAIVWQYDDLQTGTGPSLYSGTVTFDTTASGGLFYLEDLARKLGTFDMRNGSSTPFRFDDADDVWDAAPQRAAIDAHFGAMKTWEYWSTIHGRNGIDGNGGPGSQLAIDGTTLLIASRVHYGVSFNNAFWDGTRMTYGDGDGVQFSPLVALDVCGHELMHGVTQFTAGLVYAFESGALNESYSDIFGAMVERFARGDSSAIWKIGDEIYTPGNGNDDALRHMDEPHLASNKGFTADDDPDHYSERYLGSSDNGGVHINSGIANKTFYLLAAGGSHHRGGSMTGIGADKAAAIWYRALTTYMTSSTTFARAARATYDAAVALYGDASTEAQAVEQAWGLTGIPLDRTPPTIALDFPADGATVIAPISIVSTATDDVAVTAVEAYVDGVVIGTDTTSPFAITWNTVASGDGAHAVYTKAYDAAGNSAQSATATVTVQNEGIPPVVAITSPANGATVANTVTIAADATDNAAIARVDFFIDGTLRGNDATAPYSFAWNSTAVANGSHTMHAIARDTVGNWTQSATVTVTVDNDRTPPVVTILSPTTGSTVSAITTVIPNATDNVGVTRVELYVNGALRATDTAPPFELLWNTAGFFGSQTLTVRAYDALSNVGFSPAVTVTVQNETVPPVAAITAPAAGSTVDGTVTIAADASDASGITRVEFFVDGLFRGSDTTAPYQLNWNTIPVANGPHTLTARAIDIYSNSGTSAPVAVTVQHETVPPAVAITSPADGATITGTIPVAVTATDASGVTRVEIYLDGVLLGSDTTSPYQINWNSIPAGNGPHVVMAKAYDAVANTSTASITVTVDNESTPPAVAITSPADGASVSSTVTVDVTATDASGIQRVELLVDGVIALVDVSAPYQFAWDTTAWGIGAHTLTARAFDPLTNVGTASIAVTANNPGLASYDATLRAPRCLDEASSCDTGKMIDGRDGKGPEPRASNTLNGSCTDGTSGTYHGSQSLDRLRIFTADGSPLRAGRPATIEATVWSTSAADRLDLYSTTNPASPSWALIATVVPVGQGPLTLTATFVLPPGGVQAIRGNFRFGAAAAPCTTGPFDDRDDLVFAAVPDTTPPAVAITAPAPDSVVADVVDVAIAATDDGAVATVQLYVDGTPIGTDALPPYSIAWNSQLAPNGPHVLVARATDSSGNATDSAPVAVTSVNVDSTPPAAAITSPAPGATVAGTVTVTATATDNFGVAAVELRVDGELVATDATAPYALDWPTTSSGNGLHTVVVRALDTAGNAGTASITVTVDNGLGTAAYDAGLRAPRCSVVRDGCDSAGLLDGRDGKGPEPNASNTINGSCTDGTSGSYHSDESLDRLRVLTQDGSPLAAGKTVTIEATVWNRANGPNISLDLYVTTTPSSPSWTHVATLPVTGASGVRVLTTSLVLPAGTTQAIRANLRRKGSASPCSSGGTDDHDDLVFAVGP